MKSIEMPEPIYKALQRNATVVISISGDKDSQAMLYAVTEAIQAYGWSRKEINAAQMIDLISVVGNNLVVQPLPDARELAVVAAERILSLEAQLVLASIARISSKPGQLTYSPN